MKTVYDHIGIRYTKHRCADPRIVGALVRAIGLAPPAILADIGAGMGNYSRAIADLGFSVRAVEPSATMYCQAPPNSSAHWYYGTAEHIPSATAQLMASSVSLRSHHSRLLRLPLPKWRVLFNRSHCMVPSIQGSPNPLGCMTTFRLFGKACSSLPSAGRCK